MKQNKYEIQFYSPSNSHFRFISTQFDGHLKPHRDDVINRITVPQHAKICLAFNSSHKRGQDYQEDAAYTFKTIYVTVFFRCQLFVCTRAKKYFETEVWRPLVTMSLL